MIDVYCNFSALSPGCLLSLPASFPFDRKLRRSMGAEKRRASSAKGGRAMKRYWDKINDEWVYEEEPSPDNGNRAQAKEDDNLVLMISSVNNGGVPVTEE
jgi:hypothetical protein